MRGNYVRPGRSAPAARWPGNACSGPSPSRSRKAFAQAPHPRNGWRCATSRRVQPAADSGRRPASARDHCGGAADEHAGAGRAGVARAVGRSVGRCCRLRKWAAPDRQSGSGSGPRRPVRGGAGQGRTPGGGRGRRRVGATVVAQQQQARVEDSVHRQIGTAARAVVVVGSWRRLRRLRSGHSPPVLRVLGLVLREWRARVAPLRRAREQHSLGPPGGRRTSVAGFTVGRDLKRDRNRAVTGTTCRPGTIGGHGGERVDGRGGRCRPGDRFRARRARVHVVPDRGGHLVQLHQ